MPRTFSSSLRRRVDERLPLVSAQLRELRIAARDEPLAGKVRVLALEEIALVEEPELDATRRRRACGSRRSSAP